MSALEVLQSCPSQRKDLLSALGVNDDNSSSVIKFETVGLQPRFPYYVSLLIHVECLNMTVKCIVIDEGAAFSFMDRFSGYNQIQINPEDQHKTTFICPWGMFAYQKMPFSLKTLELRFSGQ